MKYFFLFILLSELTISFTSSAQLSGIKASVEIDANVTTNSVVPFWMRSNQYGSVPIEGASTSFIPSIYKNYTLDSNHNKKFIDWGFSFESRANVGNRFNVTVIESNAKVKVGIFQLKAGRSKDVMGLSGDTTLTSGNFAVSGNALGVPKIELSIPEYYTLPILSGLFAIKGNFAHGWIGKTTILPRIIGSDDKVLYEIENTNPKTYLHQKSLYVKFGKPNWKLKLIGGFSHQVFWGGEDESYAGNYKLSPLKTFFYVATGKTYGAEGVPTSKIGNQLGSIDLGLEYDFSEINLKVYRQNFYDVGALSKLANIRDGLNGITVTNKKHSPENTLISWRSFLFEFLYSANQAGYPSSIPTASGDEDYYNNFFYLNGWSYKSKGLGTPFITQRSDARPGQASYITDYFINNRVVAFNLGLRGNIKDIVLLTKLSYSENYGTFGTSVYGKSTGAIRNPQTQNIFKKVSQFSMFLQADKELSNKYICGVVIAGDAGSLLPNSFGIGLRLKKEF